jgi:CheY-like chemotaxis protein
MKTTQDTVDLARVRAEIAAGLISITDQMSQLNRVIARGGEACVERRELWRMETVQAALGKRQSALVEQMAHAASPIIVLVVEDEILVLMSAIADLEAAGFMVIEASSADEALALLEGSETIRAVFTDVQMPGTMDGLALARQVHARWPAVKVLVTSGNSIYGADDMVNGHQFMRKPYRARDVVAALLAN